MKKFLLLIGFSASSLLSIAQTCGDLQSSAIVPANPSSTQDCWLNLQVFCNVGYNLQYYDINTSGNIITVNAYYCENFLQVITFTNDSIPLGQLPAGTYFYAVNIFSAEPDCQNYVQTDQDAGSWEVSDGSAALVENAPSDVQIYPLPFDKELHIERTDAQSCIVRVHDVHGKLLMEQNGADQHLTLDFPASLEKGMYILSIASLDGKTISTHKILKR